MNETNVKSSEAWLARVGDVPISIGSHRLKMLVDEPNIVEVIGAPDNFNRLLQLQKKHYPIINLNYLLDQEGQGKVAGLVAYFNHANNQLQFGVLEFDSIPEKIIVTDDMQLGVSELPEKLQSISIMGIHFDGLNIAVLDLEKLFNNN